jgi:hypothetical protein
MGVEICNALESVRTLCHLNCITKKCHGLLPQPFYFFQSVFDHIISKNKGIVVIAQGDFVLPCKYNFID